MAFIETRFPINIGYGSHGGYRYKTEEVEFQNGQRFVWERWDSPLMRVNVKDYIRDKDDVALVMRFFNAAKGKANGFRVKDYLDFTTASDNVSSPASSDVTIGTGTGSSTTFQLKKLYTVGSTTTTRLIKKPVNGTVKVRFNATEQVEGIGFTVNYATGVISASPGLGVTVKAGCEFDIPCAFDTDDMTDLEYYVNSRDTDRNRINIPSIPLKEIRV